MMGKDSRARIKRQCRVCHDTLYATAKEITEHENLCKRMGALGLDLVGQKIIVAEGA